jgi:hypothetical protein
MKPGCPQFLALAVATLVTVAYPAVAGTLLDNQAARLTVSVTVSPICSVEITEGEATADEAVVLQCRNLPDQHPEPRIQDAEPMASGDATTSDEPATMVVINF